MCKMDFTEIERMSVIFAERYCAKCSARVEDCCMNFEAGISNETLEYCHRYSAGCLLEASVGHCLFHNLDEWIWMYDYII